MIVDYYFAPISGYAYLSHAAFLDLARDVGAAIRYRPVEIGRVFAASGTTPPAAQSEARRTYRTEDQARIAAERGLAIAGQPAHWPTDARPACRAIVAAGRVGADQGQAAFACLRAVWAEDRDIADARQLGEALAAAGLPAAGIVAEADTPEVHAEAERLTDEAIAAGVFGSPTYVVAGERFWGQDRLPALRRRLSVSARAPEPQA